MTLQDLLTTPEDTVAGNVAAAVLAGAETNTVHKLDGDDRLYAIRVADKLELIDTLELQTKYTEKYGAKPRRKTGTVHVQDADSFVTYIEKHGLPQTEVYADLAGMKLVGIINAHAEATGGMEQDAGHGDHRVVLELVHTDAWKAWRGRDKKAQTQEQFAEHLEDRANDVVNPDAATMLEIASSLIANTGVDFKSAVRLPDGQVQFRYEETTTARAGQNGDLEIPQTFTIAVAPFEGSDPVELLARFRYRISSGNLTLFYALLNPDDIVRAAFVDYVALVDDSITQPVFKGRPE